MVFQRDRGAWLEQDINVQRCVECTIRELKAFQKEKHFEKKPVSDFLLPVV